MTFNPSLQIPVVNAPFHYSSTQFQVEASDNNDPPKTKKAGVQVVFKRDKVPKFDNLPREQKISENAFNNSLVYTVRGRDDDRKVNIEIQVIMFVYASVI